MYWTDRTILHNSCSDMFDLFINIYLYFRPSIYVYFNLPLNDMASLMGWDAVSLFLLSFCAVINADTPVNCTAEDVRGSWLFLVGQGGYNNTINCLLDFRVVARFQVDLLYPVIAIDGDGNEGFWSTVCNQGLEVVIKGRK